MRLDLKHAIMNASVPAIFSEKKRSVQMIPARPTNQRVFRLGRGTRFLFAKLMNPLKGALLNEK
ncbi:hypothetical protein HMPREF9103_00700 [Lentilactobacillus parafarraginis F0439]|uniref:Uncharacterized protein n=1 Tax=Lentilactobacillus parafarraginis F0439 TaxID=797515 RepID=G9ZLV2_9LACO|nr:hypothetical protein HMPREF9103_00700 [Lentilactobacillus parafarraginis F0439]